MDAMALGQRYDASRLGDHGRPQLEAGQKSERSLAELESLPREPKKAFAGVV
jgi:hypothetical protein